MATKYIRTRMIIEESANADYSNPRKWQVEDTWSGDEFIFYDIDIPNAVETIAIANHFDTISRLLVYNNHATVTFELGVTIDGAAITMDIPAGEYVELTDVGDVNITGDGDAAASSALIWVWGT